MRFLSLGGPEDLAGESFKVVAAAVAVGLGVLGSEVVLVVVNRPWRRRHTEEDMDS